MKDGTVLVRSCSCKHEYQDEVYGPRMRVFNLKGKKEKGSQFGNTYRCTVCGTEAQG